MAERKSARGKKKAASTKRSSRTSTRPRSSRAIAQQSTKKGRKSRSRREPTVSRTRTPRSAPSSLRKKARATVLIIGMAALGFFGVLAVDMVGRIQETMSTIEFGEVWSKLKDRLLDNDVPGPKTKKKTPVRNKAVVQPKVTSPTLPAAPELPKIRSSRADVGVPSPEDYAKATQGAVESHRKESAAEAKARLDSIIDNAL